MSAPPKCRLLPARAANAKGQGGLSSEFDLIRRYFHRPAPGVVLGTGDDCALLDVPAGHYLTTSTDMLLEGRHFFSETEPRSLGHKALAVNLSDLAAMGAKPLGCLLALGLVKADSAWLAAFSQGFHELSRQAGCPLVGGDTVRSTQGVVITVTVFGSVPQGLALRRDAAQPGQDVWLTGSLGAPAIALQLLDGRMPADAALLDATRPLLEWPQPPLAFAACLPGVATAGIDISDGLLQDLQHVLQASGCGARLAYDALPVHPALARLPSEQLQPAVLAGGDVYQLCFTAVAEQRQHLTELAAKAGVRLARIGITTSEPGLMVVDARGQPLDLSAAGFDHFLD